MTTILAALRAVESGETYALRMAVDALGVALDALEDEAVESLEVAHAGAVPRR